MYLPTTGYCHHRCCGHRLLPPLCQAVVVQERALVPQFEYDDNERCVMMLACSPAAVFSLLDSACRLHASPTDFCRQVHSAHLTNPFFDRNPVGRTDDAFFTVRHYAAPVTYAVAR